MPLRKAWQFLFGYDRRDQLRKRAIGEIDMQWARVVMVDSMQKLVHTLGPAGLRALEISGDNWKGAGFKTYMEAHFPGYDICAGTLPDQFDIVLADQVFEASALAVSRGPERSCDARAGRLLPAVDAVPDPHPQQPDRLQPVDEVGMKYFLAECGFPLDKIQTWSWGNRSCVVGNFETWVPYRSRLHSLDNEPEYPVVVWALAQK
jgi:hypothetical protein